MRISNFFWKSAALLVISLMLVACGGGGGGSGGSDDTQQFTVTASAGAGGAVTPTSVSVNPNATQQFTVTPDNLFVLDNVIGTCIGLLNGNLYTAGPITADCTVEFLFVSAGPPAVPATLNLGGGQQQFIFIWTDVADATFYRLMENPDGVSGFTQLGGDIPSGTQTYQHPVTLYRRVNASYMLQSCNADGCIDDAALFAIDDLVSPIVYIKASNTGNVDGFGGSVAISADGNTLAVGANAEDSNSQTINGDGNNDLAPDSGAVYVFVRTGGVWSQQAYIKASDAAANDRFGASLSLSDNGNLLAVGAVETANGGAVYLFTRSTNTWSELQRLAHPDVDAGDNFGFSISLSGDGTRLAIGVPFDDSDGAGTFPNPPNNNNGANTGAVYIYQDLTPWVAFDYLKAGSPDNDDNFGWSVSLDIDGNTLLVGAPNEDSATLDESNNGLDSSGAAYVIQSDAVWTQQAFLKASNRTGGARFGRSVDLDTAGDTLAVGAPFESNLSGAAYVFQQGPPDRLSGLWLEYGTVFKASNPDNDDSFGRSVTLAADGNTLAIGAWREDSIGIGVASTETGNTGLNSGAAYLFGFDSSTWSTLAYVKARHFAESANFGTAVALSGDGDVLAVGALGENGTTTGVDSAPALGGVAAGAVFVY